MTNKMFSRLLIANRGEIALRINRTAKSMGIETIAIYAENEKGNLHVTAADRAESLGDGDLSSTYLNIEKIIAIAVKLKADAIHPGYGFLSENAEFAAACRSKGIVFIGPSTAVLQAMGNKIVAKSIATKAGVNILTSIPITPDTPLDIDSLQFPLMIKASYGGGGKGIQVVSNVNELQEKLVVASRTAANYFGNGEVYLESYIKDARHIEVQVLGDSYGNIIHLYERDCTLQRNHQKIVEEAPAACLSDELRINILEAALAIAREVGYENAGTVEFLVDQNNAFYFLEMNPRIQVEHPVTEEITGVDIVEEQLNIAAGYALSVKQEDIQLNGHSIELRIYQEDPLSGFTPSTKSINAFVLPHDEQIRIETDLHLYNTTSQYDPLLLKLIVHSSTRELAIEKALLALKSVQIDGPATNVQFLNALLNHDQFRQNRLNTSFISYQHQALLETSKVLRTKVAKSWIMAAALIPKPLYANKTASVWHEIGDWNINQQRTVVIDEQVNPIFWTRERNTFQLKFESQIIEGELLSYDGNDLELKIGQEIKHVLKISLPEGQTRIGVDGFIFGVFCPGVLSQYPDDFIEVKDYNQEAGDAIYSHLHGRIIKISIKKDQTVNKGDSLMIIEAMKSENIIVSPKKAKVKNISVSEGQQVTDGMELVFLEDE